MKLLTKKLRDQLRSVTYNEDEQDPIVYAKFFTCWANWTWFVTEGWEEGDDFIFFGYVIGLEKEWGNFSLRELESIRWGPLGVEREIYFTPRRLSELLDIV